MSSKTTLSVCHHPVKEASGLEQRQDVNQPASTRKHAAILITSILIIIAILQVPTILYYNDQPSEPATPSFGINFETCSADGTPATFPNATITEYCSEVPPLLTQNEFIYNTCLTLSLTLLQSINAFSSVLDNTQCNSSALPFICNATHLLCGDIGSQPTVNLQDKCIRIRDHDCAVEWRTLENIFNAILPDCASFAVGGNITFSKAPPLVCSDEFDMHCGSFCLPSCKRFSQISRNAIIISDYVTIALIALSLLGGVFTLIVCILNGKKMFQIPQIFMVYNTIILMFVLIFIVLPLIFDHSIFLCSDSNALEAFDNPTKYCQAQGFILHTGILCFTGFLLFHTAHLLFTIACPFKAKNFMNEYSKIAHIVEVVVVFAFGASPGAHVFAISKYQFDRFPPYMCYPNISVFFNVFILPLEVYATVGIVMLLLAFLFLYRNHRQLNGVKQSEKSAASSKPLCIGFSIPEIKLLILFSCYFFMVLVLLIYSTIYIQTVDSIVEILDRYFRCSIAGDRPECDAYKKDVEDVYQLPYYFSFLFYAMIAAINLGNLTYALHVHDIKLIVKKICAP